MRAARLLTAPPVAADEVTAMRAEVTALRAEVADLRASVTQLEAARAALSPEDRAHLACILPAIAGALGSELWTVRQLRTGDHPGVRVVLEGIGSRRLGKLFARGAGLPIGGYVIQRAGIEGHATLWQVLGTLGVTHSGNSATFSRATPASGTVHS